MSEIIGGAIGSAGKYDLSWVNNQLVVEVDVSKGASSAGVFVKLDAKDVIEALPLPQELKNVMEAGLAPKA